MREVCRGRKIDLNPGPLLMNPGPNRVAKRFLREAYNLFGEDRVFGRVLNRVCWQSAAIADQVPKQSKLGAAHRVLVGALQNSRGRNMVADLQLVQPAPPLHGEELVIGGGANGAPELCRQLEDRLWPRRGYGRDAVSVHSPPAPF